MAQNDTLLLIDASGLAHQAFHVSGNEPDPSFISTTIIARVRSLASEHTHAAVCLDSGKSFRADIDPSYKAQRDTENRGVIRHQIDVACETLKRDGFVVWAVKGYEADDIIATAAAQALKMDPDVSVLIASADKDLLQLASDRVSVKSLMTGNVATPADVFDKFGVKPEQMGDLLALMGDTSDNIKGADKIGKVIGARLLSEHGTLAALYEKMAHGVVSGVTPGMRTNLMEFKDRWPLVAQLIALRTDAPIEFSEIAAERVAPPLYTEMAEPFKQGDDSNDAPLPWAEQDERDKFNAVMHKASAPRELDQNESLAALSGATAKAVERIKETATNGLGQTVDTSGMRAVNAPAGAVAPYAGPVDFSQQLEPRSMHDAKDLAMMAFTSRNFSAYGTKEGILMTILAGRELGMKAMESLRNFHIIEGKPTMSADMIAGRVMTSGKAKYFKPTGRSATAASFKTLRVGDEEEPFELVYTIEEAKQAWKKDQRAWDASGWGKIPADMLVARCKSKLARLVYPDVCAGMYSVEEME